MIGLINGSFYALMSLGLSIIFGLLHVVNFAHGALYMLGAFAAWILMDQFAINYWLALVLAPLAVGILGLVPLIGLVSTLFPVSFKKRSGEELST